MLKGHFDSDEPTLILGTLTGYRIWVPKINLDGGRGITRTPNGLINWNNLQWGKYSHLRSINGAMWKVAKNKAHCRASITDHAGDAPLSKCDCGIYGYYDRGDAQTHNFRNSMQYIMGSFQAWGNTILGTKGFRCQYAKITGLVSNGNASMMSHIASLYRVSVFDSYQDLAKVFPKSDISELIK